MYSTRASLPTISSLGLGSLGAGDDHYIGPWNPRIGGAGSPSHFVRLKRIYARVAGPGSLDVYLNDTTNYDATPGLYGVAFLGSAGHQDTKGSGLMETWDNAGVPSGNYTNVPLAGNPVLDLKHCIIIPETAILLLMWAGGIEASDYAVSVSWEPVNTS